MRYSRSMNIYFSGIGGVAIGPLAELAHDAGHSVQGSDAHSSLETSELMQRGIVVTNDQSGDYLEYCHKQRRIDWLVYTAALPADHPELVRAQKLGIYTAKRDELLRYIMSEKNLKMIAIAGTHGKTTTTGMMIWVLRQLGVPISYSIGTTISFGPSGHYAPNSEYFIYECDEFDRNFLHFSPYLSLITSIDYDHPDTYPTQAAYTRAFQQFLGQSELSILWKKDTLTGLEPVNKSWVLKDEEVKSFRIPGWHNRANATLVAKACERLKLGNPDIVKVAVENFPGTQRRFERLAPGLYSDYGHHPAEIYATLQMAHEISREVTLVYQPHPNVRQHEIQSMYTHERFRYADSVYWLPTYLTRENPDLPILTPADLTKNLTRPEVHIASLNDDLWKSIMLDRDLGKLVLCMGAGTIDEWLRQHLKI